MATTAIVNIPRVISGVLGAIDEGVRGIASLGDVQARPPEDVVFLLDGAISFSSLARTKQKIFAPSITETQVSNPLFTTYMETLTPPLLPARTTRTVRETQEERTVSNISFEDQAVGVAITVDGPKSS
jgi:hypothetical protein